MQTFAEIGEKGGVFGKLYMYSYQILFMQTIHNVFIAIISIKSSEIAIEE